MTSMIIQNGIARSLGASLLVLALITNPADYAFALSPDTIDNIATVTGDSPSGTGDVTDDSGLITVDLLDPTNSLTISKSAAITTDGGASGLGDAGDVITYTYIVSNTGNTTLTSVGVTDTHDGSTTLADPTFSSWTTQAGSPTASGASITMNPGAVAIFTTTYTITTDDILAAGGGAVVDNDIDNSAIAEGTRSTTGDTVSAASVASIPLAITSTMTVAKVAYENGPAPTDIATTGLGTLTAATAERPAGTVITYVYEVENTGNVPISAIALSDDHTNSSGTSTITPTFNSVTTTSPVSSATTLYPGGKAYFTYTYTITQADIDAQ